METRQDALGMIETRGFTAMVEASDAMVKAAKVEFDALIANGTWDLVELPKGSKALPGRWVFDLKLKVDGDIERYSSQRLQTSHGRELQ